VFSQPQTPNSKLDFAPNLQPLTFTTVSVHLVEAATLRGILVEGIVKNQFVHPNILNPKPQTLNLKPFTLPSTPYTLHPTP